jgi:hypothetical protein
VAGRRPRTLHDASTHGQGPLTLASLRDRFREPIPLQGPPPGFITVDPESPEDAFDRLVRPVLVECQANRLPAISITSLTERAVPHLAMYGKAAKVLSSGRCHRRRVELLPRPATTTSTSPVPRTASRWSRS